MKIGYSIFLLMLGFCSSSFAADNYKVEKVLTANHYIINGLHWKTQDNCPAFQKGDKVSFVKGKAHSKCVATSVLHHKSNATCSLWCHDDRSDG